MRGSKFDFSSLMFYFCNIFYELLNHRRNIYNVNNIYNDNGKLLTKDRDAENKFISVLKKI